MSSKKKRQKKINFIKGLILVAIVIAAIFLAFFAVTNYIGRLAIVSGDSMNPTLVNGDLIVISEGAYNESEPERFDLVVFPYENDKNYIKRIIAMPGETVLVEDGILYINGTKVKEYYGIEPMNDKYDTSEVIRLGEDEYFVLGDNRNYSIDSRAIGAVKKSDISGKAIFRLLPLNAFGSLEEQ